MTAASPPRPVPWDAIFWGGLGVALFSFSLPATRMAVADFDPAFVAMARGAVAGLLALTALVAERPAWPSRADSARLVIVAAGVVLGWPFLTSLAMTRAGAVQGAVLTGLLPAATAVAAALLGRERPSALFWLAALAGLVCVLVFAVVQGAGRPGPADGLLLLAVALCALGYAAGGVVARHIGGGRVIGFALVLCLPVTLPLAIVHWDGAAMHRAGWMAWAGLIYVVLISQYFGFFAWYRGLARGGVARIGQLQLAQPVLSMIWAALLLHETVTAAAILAATAVLACVVMTQRAR